MEPTLADTDLLDILFGSGVQNRDGKTGMQWQSPSSPVNSTVSEPGYCMIDRWEPGEIVDQDYEVYESSSTSSLNTSPIRPVPHRYSRSMRLNVSF